MRKSGGISTRGAPERVRIRRMCEGDIAGVMELDALCLPVPWSAGTWRAEISSPIGVYLVAETSEGKVGGQIGGKKILDELHITTLAVQPESRRLGTASRLVEAAVEQAPEAVKVLLEVRVGNTGARSFYVSLGFEESGVRPRYYGDEDALLLTLVL